MMVVLFLRLQTTGMTVIFLTDKVMAEKKKKGEMPKRNKKNFRPTKSGAGMTKAGVAAYRRKNPGSKLQTAVTGKVKPR